MTRHFFRAALTLGSIMTGLGALAPILPQTDMVNHFRPYTLAGAGVVLLLALAMRAPCAARWAATLTAVNGAFFLLPLLWSAEPAEQHSTGQAMASPSRVPGQRDIRIATFNLAWRNQATTGIADFLLRTDADIVFLQEVTEQHLAILSPALASRYPHSDACVINRACRQAIFSKRPWVSVEHLHQDDRTPEVTMAAFDDQTFGRLLFYGVHLATPYRPKQAWQLDRLITERGRSTGTTIFAGDFNMTPWSYRLQRLLAATGLRRHAMFLRTWPTQGQYRLPAPAFLIDHVLTTPDIKTVSIEAGPYLGSDHLPIIATLRLPQS